MSTNTTTVWIPAKWWRNPIRWWKQRRERQALVGTPMLFYDRDRQEHHLVYIREWTDKHAALVQCADGRPLPFTPAANDIIQVVDLDPLRSRDVD